ncbi:MAG: arginine--tRNA ligase [Actinomycetota bacterium]
MPSLTDELELVLSRAIADAFGAGHAGIDPVLRRSKPGIPADYQANAAFALAKRVGRAPREVAQAIVDALPANGVVDAAEVAGNGFVNLRVRAEHLETRVGAALDDARLGIDEVADPDVVVIDYSSPNAAKELHVGHLRSTVIGDALARLLAFLGHCVVRQNHLGDWGTQFGMLIEHLVGEGSATDAALTISDLDSLYRDAQQRYQSDEEFAARARQRVVLLQSGDPATLEIWRKLIDESKRHVEHVYARLGVLLDADDYRGESFYNPMLAEVCSDLEARGIAVENDGALCVFVPGYVNRDGDPLPIILRKRDGGYNYEATDVAALRYRVDEIRGTRLVYVVDVRQSQRLAMLFDLGRMLGWLDDGRRAEHTGFGMVLGADGTPFKTRDGETVKLADLLDEAEGRARRLLDERDVAVSDRDALARQVGVGAVKYGDLSNDRTSDYRFDWDRLIRFEGDTAPYLQYAVARTRSILRKAHANFGLERPRGGTEIQVVHPEEHELALQLVSFEDAVRSAAAALEPHRLSAYLFELASQFTAFYDACPVLKADDATRASRLALCAATGATLATGLDLLGIEAPERM